jgi:epoxyqueuosine reductase
LAVTILRNVLIAIGNSGDISLAADARRLLDDANPLVRGAAVWALSRLLPRAEFVALADVSNDNDEDVREEWTAALA